MIKTIDLKTPHAPQDFVQSLQETGFAVITQHGIDAQLIADVYQDWASYFASEGKFKDLYHKSEQTGYFPLLSENAKGYSAKDLKEFFHIYLNREKYNYPAGIGNATKQLFEQLSTLAETLLQYASDALPSDIQKKLSMPLPEMVYKSESTLLRVLHYPPLQGNEPDNAVRAAAHEDINILTLLPAATTLGLEAKDTAGNWHPIMADPGMIVVNVGDMLQEATDRFYISTTHRVVNPSGPEKNLSRYSMPLFLHAKPEVRISSRYLAQEYLDERLREIGLK
jgi:isopenicillin N synthase-like dioxygenase